MRMVNSIEEVALADSYKQPLRTKPWEVRSNKS